MSNESGFIISNGILERYEGHSVNVVIPAGVKKIGENAFFSFETIETVIIPKGVTEIGYNAFCWCASLQSIILPDGLKRIGYRAFCSCLELNSVEIPNSVTEIGDNAFEDCCQLSEITIPGGISAIPDCLFLNCIDLQKVNIGNNVKTIGYRAFGNCTDLSFVDVPESVEKIWDEAFADCRSLSEVFIRSASTAPGFDVFAGCPVTIICKEDSIAHRYCEDNNLDFVFDYQYRVFGGTIPPGYRKLASPFQADEEKPYVFVSYSHLDRDRVLEELKALYESGWKIWYDEGLTIGEKYDEILEEHVRNCSAFLLFVSENSKKSSYIWNNEIPWAIQYDRPIIKCAIDNGADYDIDEGIVSGPFSPNQLENVLKAIDTLAPGEKREAKGVSVMVDPQARNDYSDNYAYCVYSDKSKDKARSFIEEAKRAGCILYDAGKEGENPEKLNKCKCLVAFMDRFFLENNVLLGILVNQQECNKAAVCKLGSIEEDRIPKELSKRHWIDVDNKNTSDMIIQLAMYLKKKNCWDVRTIPGFDYELSDSGIVIKRYKGRKSELIIDGTYGGVPVVEIAENAFENNIHVKSVIISEGVTKIGAHAFHSCYNLEKIKLPSTVTRIGAGAFEDCRKLVGVSLPDNLSAIEDRTFCGCFGLRSFDIPNTVIEIGESAFCCCNSLDKIDIPDKVTVINNSSFAFCGNLSSVTIRGNVTRIGDSAFRACNSLTEFVIPQSVTEIDELAFECCKSLRSITLPDGLIKIGDRAIDFCRELTSLSIPDSVRSIGERAFLHHSEKFICRCKKGSCAWEYCKKNKIAVEAE